MLRAKLQEDQLSALKSGEKERLDTLRYILSRVKNQEIEKKGELDDAQTVDVLRKIKKELAESIESFEKGGRSVLAQSSKSQLAIVNSYLPAEMTDDELQKAVAEVKAAHAQTVEANPKVLIGLCIKELKDKADTSRIVKAVQELEN